MATCATIPGFVLSSFVCIRDIDVTCTSIRPCEIVGGLLLWVIFKRQIEGRISRRFVQCIFVVGTLVGTASQTEGDEHAIGGSNVGELAPERKCICFERDT